MNALALLTVLGAFDIPPAALGVFFGAVVCTFAAVALLVWGIVPEEVDEEDIYGYRLTKRQQLIEENDLYAAVLPLVKMFGHHFQRAPDTKFINFTEKRADLRDKLVRSGFMGAFTPNEFWGMCVVSGLGTFCIVIVLTWIYSDFPNVPIAMILGLGGCSIPYLQIDGAIQNRLIEIDRRLPYAVDLLVLSMRAGLDFMSALDRVVTSGLEQNPGDPMIQELGVVLQEMRVGTSREDALINLCERVRSEYLKSMVGAILQSEKRGTPLATVLEIQVTTIRSKRTARIEKAASQAAVKMLGPLMFIFGAVVVVMMGAVGLKLYYSGAM